MAHCEFCDKPTKAREMCSMHYERFRKHGNALIELPFQKPPVAQPCKDDCNCGRHSVKETCFKPGEQHPNWKASSVSRKSAHDRVKRARGKASNHSCVDCQEKAIDWSRKTNANHFEISNYEPRCRKCHYIYDIELHEKGQITKMQNRLNKLKQVI